MTRLEKIQSEYHHSKFIRVEGEIYSTAPNDLDTPHDYLASGDKLLGRIKELMATDISELDAGCYGVFNQSVAVYSNSTNLGLPRDDSARGKTIDVFRSLVPQDWTVEEFQS